MLSKEKSVLPAKKAGSHRKHIGKLPASYYCSYEHIFIRRYSRNLSHLLIFALFAGLHSDQYFVLPTVLYVLIRT